MKTKYKLFVLLSLILPLAMMGCSNNEDNLPRADIPEIVVPEMIIPKEITVKIGTDVNIDITQGGGEYSAFSLNEDIAKVVQSADNKLTIQGVKSGKTSLIISDKNSNYQRLPVMVSEYDELKIDQKEIALKLLLGESKETTINILEGNGEYTILSDNKIVEPSVKNNLITLKAKSEDGTANITVTDASGFQAVIRVQITVSSIPYDEAELDAIKTNDTLRYFFADRQFENTNTTFTFLNEQIDNLNLYGWTRGSLTFLKIYFAGNKEVGEKSESKLDHRYASAATFFNSQPIKFEIIKNDGTKIWATYSFIKDNKLYFGHFCQNINNDPVKENTNPNTDTNPKFDYPMEELIGSWRVTHIENPMNGTMTDVALFPKFPPSPHLIFKNDGSFSSTLWDPEGKKVEGGYKVNGKFIDFFSGTQKICSFEVISWSSSECEIVQFFDGEPVPPMRHKFTKQ